MKNNNCKTNSPTLKNHKQLTQAIYREQQTEGQQQEWQAGGGGWRGGVAAVVSARQDAASELFAAKFEDPTLGVHVFQHTRPDHQGLARPH